MQDKKAKILIADDHKLFQDALVTYIERAKISSHITLAKDLGQVTSILEKDPHYDLVMLDFGMPGMEGVLGFKKLRQKHPSVKLALMSGIAKPEDIMAAKSAGAAAYFPKTMPGKTLIQAIESVLRGDSFFPHDERTKSIMPSFYADEKKQPANLNLTPRELEVLKLLSRGIQNKEIANILNVQLVTVKLHVRGICRKLSVKNRTQAALKAQDLGIVT